MEQKEKKKRTLYLGGVIAGALCGIALGFVVPYGGNLTHTVTIAVQHLQPQRVHALATAAQRTVGQFANRPHTGTRDAAQREQQKQPLPAVRPAVRDSDGTAVVQRCENGIVEGTEECDDGNSDYGDACTKYCLAARCGDGIIQRGVEHCDDGNTEDGDGCSSACDVEVITPQCGAAVQRATCAQPTEDLCSGAVPTQPRAGGTAWTWRCGDQTCTALRQCGYTATP